MLTLGDGMDKKTRHCLQETHFRSQDTHRLKVKHGKRYQQNGNFKKKLGQQQLYQKKQTLKQRLYQETKKNSIISLLGIYLKKPKTLNRKNKTCIPVFIVALFTIAETWKQLKYPSINEWIKKWCVYKNMIQQKN